MQVQLEELSSSIVWSTWTTVRFKTESCWRVGTWSVMSHAKSVMLNWAGSTSLPRRRTSGTRKVVWFWRGHWSRKARALMTSQHRIRTIVDEENCDWWNRPCNYDGFSSKDWNSATLRYTTQESLCYSRGEDRVGQLAWVVWSLCDTVYENGPLTLCLWCL